jgi:NADP-dependent 3-hydroxy acid dehydrogenase YdfG
VLKEEHNLLYSLEALHYIAMKEFIVVTGSGKGIGREVVTRLCALGHNIIGISRTAKDLEELESEVCKNKNITFIKIQCDVSNYTDFFCKVDQIYNKKISIRALITNAGWGEWYPATTTPIDEWHGMINTNLTGVFNSLKIFYNKFNVTDNFQVIAISSDSAYNAYSNRAAYCSSKAGLSMFIDCVREELREKKYRVTEIVPSRVDTNFRKKTTGSRKDSLKSKDIAEIIQWLLTINEDLEIRKLDVSSINSTFGR